MAVALLLPTGAVPFGGTPNMTLAEYRKKRDFSKTPEPDPKPGKKHKQTIFVIQEHHASHLHYDFRLEADGVLKSWAVPKEPSLDPSQKRLAVRVEDHPLGYAGFHGDIPAGQYGAGHVEIWDRGTYEPDASDRTVAEGIDAGRLEFTLHGERLNGRFTLVRMKGGKGRKENWLLIKRKDAFARSSEPAAPKKPRPTTKAARTRPVGAGPKEVTLTHAEKVLFPEVGATKGEVFDYYRRVGPRLLPYLRDRPVTLERLPEGLGEGKPHFWQKHTPPSYPDWIPRVELPSEDGRSVAYSMVNDIETLLYLVNQGALDVPPLVVARRQSRPAGLRPLRSRPRRGGVRRSHRDRPTVARAADRGGRRGGRENVGQVRVARADALAGGRRIRRGADLGAGGRGTADRGGAGTGDLGDPQGQARPPRLRGRAAKRRAANTSCRRMCCGRRRRRRFRRRCAGPS